MVKLPSLEMEANKEFLLLNRYMFLYLLIMVAKFSLRLFSDGVMQAVEYFLNSGSVYATSDNNNENELVRYSAVKIFFVSFV